MWADERDATGAKVLVTDVPQPGGQLRQTYTIFEGTSEIQRLIISRAISGVHIK